MHSIEGRNPMHALQEMIGVMRSVSVTSAYLGVVS